eukprot:TRINITY_DN25569_c0_g1_i1.p1 TRINITY_DN25569_c0_g1~~TRINITY_DN25569_c0_g1_i1.p1  ORF type:complete len:187 (-),score=43.82 TRINITY_DN25569_c0_g1_i1:6-566(-)
MSNVQPFALETVELTPTEVKDFLKCILHTIIFHRVLRPMAPREERIESIDFAYICCDDAEIHKRVEKRATQASLDPPSRVVLRFNVSEKHWLSTDVNCWEQWTIGIKLLPTVSPQEQRERRDLVSSQLRRSILSVVSHVNAHQSHLPPRAKMAERDFSIEIPEHDHRGWSFSNIFKLDTNLSADQL